MDRRYALTMDGDLLCLLRRVEAVYQRLKTMRRQIYGEDYDLDVWCEIEIKLEAIVKDYKDLRELN